MTLQVEARVEGIVLLASTCNVIHVNQALPLIFMRTVRRSFNKARGRGWKEANGRSMYLGVGLPSLPHAPENHKIETKSTTKTGPLEKEGFLGET